MGHDPVELASAVSEFLQLPMRFTRDPHELVSWAFGGRFTGALGGRTPPEEKMS